MVGRAYEWGHEGGIGHCRACPGGLDVFCLYELLIMSFDALQSFILRFCEQIFKYSLQLETYQGFQSYFKRLHGVGKFMDGRAALSYF